MSNSKSGHILYIMVHVPFFIFIKIGITGKRVKDRAKAVDRAVIGFPIPVMAVVIPGAYYFEQSLHRHFRWFNFKFYKGDGASEWFFLPVLIIVWPMLLSVWLCYIWIFDACTGTRFFPIVLHFIVDKILKYFFQ